MSGMLQITRLEPVDYLMIGHLTVDLTEQGPLIGGTAAYSALTARALGLRVGIVTAWGGEISLAPFGDIPIAGLNAPVSTTFKNVYTPTGRTQTIIDVAPKLEMEHIPEPWRQAAIVHLGPVAQEMDTSLIRQFPASLIGLTPQGWMRSWNAQGRVIPTTWTQASIVLKYAGAAVIGLEDIQHDEVLLEEMVDSCAVFAATEGAQGVRLFWNKDVRRFRPPRMDEVDSTGAGDIFAAAFFVRLYATRDPWEAARFATELSAFSVTRRGLVGIPTQDEIKKCMVEVL
jgi:sugar/nucleoside kinase (ribokinase family)